MKRFNMEGGQMVEGQTGEFVSANEADAEIEHLLEVVDLLFTHLRDERTSSSTHSRMCADAALKAATPYAMRSGFKPNSVLSKAYRAAKVD